MSRINTNVSSLSAQARLQRTNKDLQTSLTRLSTGLRINTGADDPAGLIASEALRSDITSLNKALSNTQRASQIIATADSALGQVSSLLNDIRGLVVEAANNGALSQDEIAANQLQVDSSLEAINRISQTTTFQGRKLLDGSLDFLTTAGTGFGTVSDLKIDQANLGATGKVSVEVNISQAASKASILNTGIAATGTAAKSAGSITFDTSVPDTEATIRIDVDDAFTIGAQATRNVALTNAFTPNGEAAYNNVSIGATSGVNLNITAVNGGPYDGTEGNGLQIQVTHSATATTSSGSYNATTKTLSLTIANGSNTATIASDLGTSIAGWSFAAGSSAAAVTNSATDANDVAPRSLTPTTAGTNTLSTGTNFTLTAVDGGRADGAKGNSTSVRFTTGTATGAEYDPDANAILVTVASTGATINQIITAINNDIGTDFQAANAANGTYRYSAADNGTLSGTFGGGSNPIAAAGFSLEAVDGQALDGIRGNTVTFNYTAGTGTATTATYDATANQVNVTFGTAATVNDVANAIADINGTGTSKLFQIKAGSVINGTSRFTTADTDADTNTVSRTVTTTAANKNVTDVINVVAKKDGSEFDKTISFATSTSVAVGAAAASLDNSGNIVITTNTGGNVSVGAIVNAINQLENYSATSTADPLADNTFTVGTDTPTIVNLQNGNQGGGLNADLVFQLSGGNGSETFQFQKGAKIESIVQSINLVKDATGVEAVIESGNLKFQSTGYGSKAQVAIEVISEGTGGTFKSNLSSSRSTGTDIQATVNGYTATGSGNTLSINTASLDLSLTVAAGSSTSVNFEITGGGALFQLGGDVVSNQQARLGISSVSTAKLGGSSGRLFELGSGQSKSLLSDATGAAQVIEEVINKVTSLRGRLGAFQRTTLDSNSVSLTETVANLTEAESSIRDADFAKESAALTRAQILVQSGTNVLSIANQNPQNVLSLLR